MILSEQYKNRLQELAGILVLNEAFNEKIQIDPKTIEILKEGNNFKSYFYFRTFKYVILFQKEDDNFKFNDINFNPEDSKIKEIVNNTTSRYDCRFGIKNELDPTSVDFSKTINSAKPISILQLVVFIIDKFLTEYNVDIIFFKAELQREKIYKEIINKLSNNYYHYVSEIGNEKTNFLIKNSLIVG